MRITLPPRESSGSLSVRRIDALANQPAIRSVVAALLRLGLLQLSTEGPRWDRIRVWTARADDSDAARFRQSFALHVAGWTNAGRPALRACRPALPAALHASSLHFF